MAKDLIGLGKDFDSMKKDKWRIKVAQDMHFKNFYRSFYEYLEDNEYVSQDGDDKYETFYDEKHHPNGVREYRLRWRAYHKFNNSDVLSKFTFDWLVLSCKDKEIVSNGKKIKVQNLEIEITCETYLQINKDKLKKSKFLSTFANLFFDRWFRHLSEGYKNRAKARSKEIEEFLKGLFDTVKYTSESPEFNRTRGYEDSHKD